MTDESHVYTRVGREFNGHSVVNHSAKEYVTTGGFKHSNTRKITDGERAALILKGGEGRRLTYRRTDKLAA